MATYLELRSLFNDGDLRNKLDVAVIVAANTLLSGSPTANDQKWAAQAFNHPREESTKALSAVLAENKDLSVAQIQGAADAGIQTQVDAVVPNLVSAFNAG